MVNDRSASSEDEDDDENEDNEDDKNEISKKKETPKKVFWFFSLVYVYIMFWHIIPHQLSVSKFFIITWRLDQARKDLQSLFQKHLFLIRRQNLLLPKRLVSCLDFELCSFSPL